MKFAVAFAAAVFALAPGMAAAQETQAPPPRHPFDIPFPSPDPPYTWPNEHGQLVECTTSPFQRIDLGVVDLGVGEPMHIYAGDGCSMPSSDLVSSKYKEVFGEACRLHDICYLGPGNSKGYCDDMFKWHMDRDCDRAYAGSPTDFFKAAAREQCHVAAMAWRAGLETPLSSEYFKRSQGWGQGNCKITTGLRPVPK